MNNVFEVSQFLKTRNAKQKYEYWVDQLNKYSKDSIYLKKQNKHVNKTKLLKHLNNIKYIIYGNLPKEYGGVGLKNLKRLRLNDNEDNDDIYEEIFNLILTPKDIITPLCNCCLVEFKNKDKGWKTTKKKEKEYFKDLDGNEYISENYIHICKDCHILLTNKIEKYKQLEIEKFNKNVFLKQTDEYMEYQPICFKLLI